MRLLTNFILILTIIFCVPGSIQAQQIETGVVLRYLGEWSNEEYPDPTALAVDPAGWVYLADAGTHRIFKLDSLGQVTAVIGGLGWGDEELDHPVSVDAANGLDVLVADYYNHRIQRYDKDLHFLATLQSGENLPARFSFLYPRDAVLSKQGELFCLDEDNSRVIKLDVQGKPQTSFGDVDSGTGKLTSPVSLLISRQDRVYVADPGQHCLVVFDTYGTFLFKMGEGVLHAPAAVAEITADLLFVIDAETGAIQSFTSAGVYRGMVPNPVRLDKPRDIACGQDRLLVLDGKSKSIQLFRLERAEETR